MMGMFGSLFSRPSAAAPSAPQGDEAVPETPFPITLTPRAIEMVQQAMSEDPEAGGALRIGVTGGGCSGLQYMLDFAPPASELDFEAAQQGLQICIDPFSAAHLAGTTIDYVDGLNGTGFRFENPNVVRACGCGSSFQT